MLVPASVVIFSDLPEPPIPKEAQDKISPSVLYEPLRGRPAYAAGGMAAQLHPGLVVRVLRHP